MDRRENGKESKSLRQGLAWIAHKLGYASIDLDHSIREVIDSKEALRFAELPDSAAVIPLDSYRKRKLEKPAQYPDLIKVTFNGQVELMDEVVKVSHERGISPTTFINQALSTELFISDKRERGKKILYEESPGNIREIIWVKED